MLLTAFIYMTATVIAVCLVRSLGVTSIVGYLLAGIVIGPSMLGLVGNQSEVVHYAEFGVVMMLFLIGLELNPRRLWALRKAIFILGPLQVVGTCVLIGSVLWLSSRAETYLVYLIGFALALSSTAIVLQLLSEGSLLNRPIGQRTFAVLLFQDMIFVPILILLPLMGQSGEVTVVNDPSRIEAFIDQWPQWVKASTSAVLLVLVVVGGRFLARPLLYLVASTRMAETFTAFALLIVIASSLGMEALGLSPAFGAFLAGVFLAENEFRHELRIRIEPFKGLLLGLFFVTVGTGIDFSFVAEFPVIIIGSVLAMMLIKILVLLAVSPFRVPWRERLTFALMLAQGGEFAFVITIEAKSFGLMSSDLAGGINAVVALSMLLSPIFLSALTWWIQRRRLGNPVESPHLLNAPDAKHFSLTSPRVVLVGHGRFGKVLYRLLSDQGFELVSLDADPREVRAARRGGDNVYYGDATDPDVLAAVGLGTAELLIVAIDKPERSLSVVEASKTRFPQVKILARAQNLPHAFRLFDCDIAGFRVEVFDAALYLGENALRLLGVDDEQAQGLCRVFSERDAESIEVLAQAWRNQKKR